MPIKARMGSRRPIFLLVGAALVGIGGVWLIARPPFAPRVSELVPGEPYSLGVTSERSRADLSFDHGSRYILIIGSLGDGRRDYEVALSAEPVEAIDPFRASRIEPLETGVRAHSNPLARDLARSREGEAPAEPQPSVEDSLRESQRDSRSESPTLKTARREPRPPKHAGSAAASSLARTFYIHVTDGTLDDPKHYARVTGRLVGEGSHVRIYLDDLQSPPQLAAGLIGEITRVFDEEIVPVARRRLGTYRDVDGDGKFAILLSPWLARLRGGRTSLGGFVRGADFRRDAQPPFSNRCDMMYLNSNLRPGRHLKTLLAHEFAHAVCFSERLPGGAALRGCPDEEDWLNEAIAHLAENLHGPVWTNLDYRISRFLDDPQQYPLVVPDYYAAGLWRDHGCRGATYLFLRWCADRFGDRVVQRLIRGAGRGTGNLERATGVEFEELYRRWTIALWQSGRHVEPNCQTRSGAPAGQYRFLDICGPLARRGLAGPRTVDWDVDSGSRTVSLKGTATAFLELRATGPPGVRRVRIAAEPGTRLQVSVIRLPSDWPRIGVAAEWAERSSSRPSKPDPGQVLSVRVLPESGAKLRVEMIACESSDDNRRQPLCLTGSELDGRRVASPAGSGCDPIVEGFELPIDLRANAEPGGEDGFVLKVVARDEQGRRAVVWQVIGGPTSADPNLRLADAPR